MKNALTQKELLKLIRMYDDAFEQGQMVTMYKHNRQIKESSKVLTDHNTDRKEFITLLDKLTDVGF